MSSHDERTRLMSDQHENGKHYHGGVYVVNATDPSRTVWDREVEEGVKALPVEAVALQRRLSARQVQMIAIGELSYRR